MTRLTTGRRHCDTCRRLIGNVALTATITASPTGAQYPPNLSFGPTSPVGITGASAATATLTLYTTGATSVALVRLLGCTRWQENTPGERVCLLSIPVNKTSTAFSKPVDTIVGEIVEAWEKERPGQTKIIDPKTGEQADYLLAYRSKALGYRYEFQWGRKVLFLSKGPDARLHLLCRAEI